MPALSAALCGVRRPADRTNTQQTTFAVVRAYADDTAVLVQNLWKDAPILAKTFEEFAQISNLSLNLNKTLVVPFFPQPSLSEAKATLSQIAASWSAAQFAYHARYLGFLMGPEAGNKGWREATSKFQQRAQTWSDLHAGFHCTVVAYNVFALSVLTYLSQLIQPPDEVFEVENQSLRRIAPGPRGWISNSDLWWPRTLTGRPASPASLRLTSQAAQARVRVWDPACADEELDACTVLEITNARQHPTRNRDYLDTSPASRLPNNLSPTSMFSHRAQHLRTVVQSSEQFYTGAKWKDWFDQSMLLTLEDNLT